MRRAWIIILVIVFAPCIAIASLTGGLQGGGSGAGWTQATDCSGTTTNGAGCYNLSTQKLCIGNGESCAIVQDGTSAYVYQAWASDASGTDFTTTFDADLNYTAFLTTTTEIASPEASDFAGLWKNYKGATGPQGEQGVQGPVGETGATGPAGAGITSSSDCSEITSGICIDTDDGKLYCWNGSAVEECGAGDWQPVLTNPVTGPASPTAGYLAKWGPSGQALVDGLGLGTLTDTKYCTYVAGTGLQCNSDGSGSMTYPGAGIPLSTGSAWGTSLTGTALQYLRRNSGNTAYEFGALPEADAGGTNKGVAGFTANDFDASSGIISIDYANGQAASGSAKGFLTPADWTTFNGKQAALTNPLVQADVDDVPVDGATTAPVSSNWAYDHAAATNPHTGAQPLDSALTTLASKVWAASGTIGGTAGMLDAIPVASLADGDTAIVSTTGGKTQVYYYESSSAADEADNSVVQPDDNAGNGRWLIQLWIESGVVQFASVIIPNGTSTPATCTEGIALTLETIIFT